MSTVLEIGIKAKEAAAQIGILDTNRKNEILKAAAKNLVKHASEIIEANHIDLINGRKNNMPEGLLDRLMLNEDRIKGMANALVKVSDLDDPIGEVTSMKKMPNGLSIGKKRVPLGVVGIIYEARPNVTSDAFGLCFKTGNAVILKGGSDAINSNIAIVKYIREALGELNIDQNAISLIENTSREAARELMQLNGYVDVLIPRGSAGLIKSVVENSTVPVIETGSGNCHIYVDATADFDMALDIIFNAKTQRIGVCNSCESLVIHDSIIDKFMPLLKKRLDTKNVEIRGDERAVCAEPSINAAVEEDFKTEYLDYIISVKTVSNIEEAIRHINKYNTKHSEAIITKDYDNAQKFLNEIDAAAVYVNASTRFTDGEEFGFGAEIGISTQKLHARGPMGLKELTSVKYIIYGNGQIR